MQLQGEGPGEQVDRHIQPAAPGVLQHDSGQPQEPHVADDVQPSAVEEIRREIGVPGGVRRDEGVALQRRAGAEFLITRREAVHLLLQGLGIVHQPDARVPAILQIAMRVLGEGPGAGFVFLYVVHQLLRFGRQGELRMHGREQANVQPRLGQLGGRLLERGKGKQERNQVDHDEPDRHDRPSPRLHVFMAGRQQHKLSSTPTSRPRLAGDPICQTEVCPAF